MRRKAMETTKLMVSLDDKPVTGLFLQFCNWQLLHVEYYKNHAIVEVFGMGASEFMSLSMQGYKVKFIE
jgi:hypothetical protein